MLREGRRRGGEGVMLTEGVMLGEGVVKGWVMLREDNIERGL